MSAASFASPSDGGGETDQGLYRARRALPAQVPFGVTIKVEAAGATREGATGTQKVGAAEDRTSSTGEGMSLGADDLDRPSQSVEPIRGEALEIHASPGALLQQRVSAKPVCVPRPDTVAPNQWEGE
eukprot:CAMPEP_0181290576 /NCGR_PEP_ID=MMETSP1101-20121128/1486_1 /TAXON_ID=46948 /ORGANISM="Rhodomonas abbreviata, Strain Caron Lab Isolate" /LENGTH=126 /DNA_ID=CAMNT_0023394867 /DNA_START=951 /DNA_END=1330 /DNA_ORIENTATION=-